MCGILCLVLEGGVSGLTPCVVTGQTEVYNQWIAGDESVVLTEAMRTKLDNLERIRTATQRLKTVRNDVKGKHRVEREMLEKEIAKLTLEGSESLSSSSPSSTPQTAAQAPLAGPIKQFKSLESSIAARGPDYVSRQVHGKYALFSSILSLRQPFTSQPMSTTNGFILQFNGELYNEECLESCDTSFIASMLAVIPSEARQQGVIDLLNRLKGEFAINIIDITEDIVYFGRDQIGKRSLLYRQEQDSLLIGSVAHDSSWTECQNRIYIYANGVIDSQPYDNYNSPLDMDVSLDIIEETLKKAVSIRTSTIHPQVTTPSTLAVLFSGGLDCTVLAYLLGNELRCTNHQIDLLTVGFDNPRINQTASSSPDRLLARKSWANLSKIFAEDSVVFNLVEINVTYAEWLTHKERVTRLMAPSNTEMDLSIAIAFYFASNSRYPSVKTTLVGTEEHCVENYKSTAKVLFSGLGADELFAGYSRHEALFSDIAEDTEDNKVTEMYKALHASLVYDVDVIHKRNLGRDDRVIACWGKEVRYPYLDPDFISVAMAVSPRQKITYSFKTVVTKKCLEGKRVLVLERKHILRQLAGRLGLEWVKGELKRAIQFGAKSAKLEVGQSKTKGTDTL